MPLPHYLLEWALDSKLPGSAWLGSNSARSLPLRRRRRGTVELAKTALLFVATALAEIVGCYLPYLWLRQSHSPWLLVPSALILAIFAWLLTLHPTAASRVYAAYGGVYITVALTWLWLVDGVKPEPADFAGVALCLAGMAVIMLGHRG